MVWPVWRGDKRRAMVGLMRPGVWLLLLSACGFETVENTPDLAGVPCTVVPAGGCAQGDKCIYINGGTHCVADGTVAPGGRCSSQSIARAGSIALLMPMLV